MGLEGEIPKCPQGVAVNSKGLIAVADDERHCILIYDKEGNYVGCYGNNTGRLTAHVM